MPKMKTKSSAKKRFRVTGSGKIKFTKAFRRHLLTKKNRNLKRNMRRAGYIAACDLPNVQILLPYAAK
ncbi:MAG TPA: 50S ribosomal protein L35 [Candidatus Babeliales bacterium]|nr:50S ribosomal protein L35 [Candidatus Babeliales bacterium]